MSKDLKLQFIDDCVQRVVRYLPQCSDEVAFFIACQFALESNYGTSSLAMRHFNYCGMKVPNSRLSLNTACDGFAQYNCIDDCFIDYVLWLTFNHFTSQQVFNLSLFKMRLRACGYCPEKDYLDKINQIFNQLNSTNYVRKK